MKRFDASLVSAFSVIELALALAVGGVWAKEPTLARLSFWAPPARMEEFEAAYDAQVIPVLKKHSLIASSEQGRTTSDSVFSRFFALTTPSEVAAIKKALNKDPAWQEVVWNLGMTFGTILPDSLVRFHFGLCKTPAGSGKAREAGPGFRQGLWHTFGVQDGLPSPRVQGSLQDRAGFLWFATWGGGVSRYDGARWVTFTTKDGLASNWVWSILEDRQGNLWFGTLGGVSQYDGKEFVTFTTEDGLAENRVYAIFEDRQGDLWFMTFGGVSRYDGKEFVAFTVGEGLAENRVNAILEDRQGNRWFATGGGVSRYNDAQ